MISVNKITWAKVFMILLLISCVKDPGNYDYIDPAQLEPFHLEGLEEQYNVKALEHFRLDPVLPQGISETDYDYLWYLNKSKSDTIARTLALDFQVTQAFGDYELVLQAKNRKTDVCVYHKSKLSISSEFSRGWYVTKDENQVTDLDWINPEGKVFANVLASVNGEGLKGEACKTTYMGGRYNYEQENPDGTVSLVENQKVLFVMSRSDMRIYDSENLKLIREFGDIFVKAPEIAAPQDAVHGFFLGSFILNNGKVHSLSTITAPSYGKFGVEKLGDYEASDYSVLVPMGELVFFDKCSHSFCYAKVQKNMIQQFSYNPARDKADPNNMNCDLLFMKERKLNDYTLNTGFALLKNREKEEYYFAGIDPNATSAGAHLFDSYDTLPALNEVGKGKVFGAHQLNSTLYFSMGDPVLKSLNTGNFSENPEVFTFPEDEKITFIGHISYNDYSQPQDNMQCLAVLTNTGSRWKLYCFDFVGQTSDIVTTGYKVYSGNGHANSVIYRGPGTVNIN